MDNCDFDKFCRKGLLIAFAVTAFLSVISVHFYENQHEYYQEQRYINKVMCAENLVTGVTLKHQQESLRTACFLIEEAVNEGSIQDKNYLVSCVLYNIRRSINE